MTERQARERGRQKWTKRWEGKQNESETQRQGDGVRQEVSEKDGEEINRKKRVREREQERDMDKT